MNENKRNQLKQSLEEAKNKLKELKSTNPDGNYEELERMIQKMNDLIYLPNSTNTNAFLALIKVLLAFILSYVVITVFVAVTFGLMYFILNPIEPTQFITIVPITSLILFLSFRIGSLLSNHFAKNHPILALFIFSGMVIWVLALIDNAYIHLCGNFSDSLLLASAQVIIGLILDLYVAQKIILYVGDSL